jgi:type 1 glutamine amidotransferase
MLKRLSIAVLTGLTLCWGAQAADKIKVLIVTGDDVNVHPWKTVAPATKDILMAAGKFDVKITENPKDLENASDLKSYDVVFLALYNAKLPTLTDTAKQNLLDFVKGGKGFVVSHLASASFKEWDEFKKLCGRYWVMGKSGHGPRSKFKVNIKDKDNPIVKGLEDFEADDELYAKLEGDAPIQVLATADSNWSKKTEPMVFTTTYGQGRVFHETFGHDPKALDNAAIKAIIQRGTEWAATGKVQ